MPAPLDHQILAALLARQAGGPLHPLDVGHVLFGVLQVLVEPFVELADGLAPGNLPRFDLVQLLFHARGVLNVEDIVEVLQQQPGHHSAQLGGVEPTALLLHVLAFLNGGEDGGVGGRTAHAVGFQFLHQRGLVVARRRLGEVLLGQKVAELEMFTLGHGGEPVFGLLVFFVDLVLALFVDPEKAAKLEHRPGGAKEVIAGVLAARRDVDGGLVENRGRHLAGHEAVPDQAVEFEFVLRQILGHVVGAVLHGSGADGFVRILGLLLGLVNIGGLRQKLRPELDRDISARFLQRVFGNPRGVRAHVGDQADRALFAQLDALVEPLRQDHGALDAEAQLARRFLLQCGGDEGRHRIAALLARTDRLDDVIRAIELRDHPISDLLAAELRRLVVLFDQVRVQQRRFARAQVRVDGPILVLEERGDFALALHDHTQRYGLHAAGGEAPPDFIP